VPDPDDPMGSDAPLDRPPPPRTWRERIDDIADATGVGPARLVAGGAVVAAAVLVALWAMRPPPAPAELDIPFAPTTEARDGGSASTASTASTADDGSGAVPAAGASSSTPAGQLPAPEGETPDAGVVVHVAGAVHDAGVHRLDPGARVVDAVLAAGGLHPDADESRVNLASPVSDGERVYVPHLGEDTPPSPVAGSAGTAAPEAADADAPVDLNRATAQELESLPGVGPATATAILEHRARVGAFTSVDQLIDVRGIGPAKLEQLLPRVQV
jgi:competence protein ComEA